MAKRLVSQHFHHPDFGEASIIVKSNARNISARWSSDILKVTVPPAVTADQMLRALETMKPRILANRPVKRHYAPGWQYVTPEMVFSIVENPRSPDVSFETSITNGMCVIKVPPHLPDESVDVIDSFIRDSLIDYADKRTSIIIGLARQMARELRVNPRSITVSRGEKLLGRCSAKGDISLSRNLIFYPVEARRYVIAHEFAHLTHMNHSEAFHDLVDEYLDGHSHEYRATLKTHSLPFL